MPNARGKHHPDRPRRRDRPASAGKLCWRKSIPSDPARLREVRKGIERFTRDAGFDHKSAEEIGLCVNEALANIMRHAYHGAVDRPIRIDARCDGEAISLSLRDWGDGFNPAAAAQRDYNPLEPGGLGMICLCRLMDEVNYHPRSPGTLLTMRRRKP